MGKAPDTPVSFDTTPYGWTHWKLELDGDVAKLVMDIQEHGGMRPGYELKLNSYDLGVDIELYDAIQRIAFEHPEVKTVVVTSAIDRVFCSGANIYMLGMSSHPFKVNFCKFTNETRCALEEPEMPTFVAALNGACAGGGYELAMACEHIWLIDDGSSAVSLPEVPLLGVLPGTGGLTRLVDKRKVRRDVADVFCCKAEGFRARDAKKWDLVDETWPRSKWDAHVATRAQELAAAYDGPTGTGITLSPLTDTPTETGLAWTHVALDLDSQARTATLTVKAPTTEPPASAEELHALGAEAWSLAAFRELERAIFHLRFNHLDLGLLLVKTEGDGDRVLAWDEALATLAEQGDWLAQRTRGFQRRTLTRMDNMARSIFALIEEGHAFSGVLFELALGADRSYMFLDEDAENTVTLGPANAGAFPMANGLSRLANRYYGQPESVSELLSRGEPIDAADAEELGLVTMSPDDIDWEDDVRIAIEERVSLSPDALTGMEQNLRFCGGEGTENRIYGRLSAWQNWIFQRPNAVGENGALTLYGRPERPVFDYRRT